MFVKRFFLLLALVGCLCLPIHATGEFGLPTSAVDDPVASVVDGSPSAVLYPSPDGVLPQAIVDLFGEYSPVVYDYDSYTVPVPGLAGLDWVWLTSVSLFGVTLYCVLRMIGGLLRWM